MFGINPGRLGSGLTGVTFTDPVALSDFCGIANSLPRNRERSSEFIYAAIERYGGPVKFYRQFFLTAISPLGFTRCGVNYNYYDSPAILKATRPFIIETLNAQIALGAVRDHAILLGTGKNHRFFSELNDEHSFFKNVRAVEHPRFIMQYRRKAFADYIEKYHQIFVEVPG